MATKKDQTVAEAVSIDDVIGSASPVERIVKVCVAGHLSGEYERIRADIDDANQASLERLSGNADTSALRKELDEVAEKMRAQTFTFRFQAVSPKKWSDLIAEHPDKDGDRLFNPETFPTAAIAATCVEPTGMDAPEKVDALMEKLSPAQQSDLFDGAWMVNTSAPKGLTSSPASGGRLS